MNRYPAVILAAGRGNRMGELGNRVPKPLLPVGDEPIIGHQLRMLQALGVREAHVVVGHRAPDVVRFLGDGSAYGIELRYVEQTEQLGIAHAVGTLRRTLTTPFLLLLGDYFFIAEDPSRLVHCLDQGHSAQLAKREADPRLISESCELRIGEHGLVTSLIEKPMRPRGDIKGCGFYALQPEICDYIARTPRTALRDEYEFTLTLDLFVRDGNPLHAETMAVWDHNFTYPFDVLDCNLTWLDNQKLRVFVAQSAIVGSDVELDNVVIGGNAHVARNARLRDVVVFPGARVEAGEAIQEALATPHGIVRATRRDARTPVGPVA
jgi:NDP-sugar pyrophosphorylase family protein